MYGHPARLPPSASQAVPPDADRWKADGLMLEQGMAPLRTPRTKFRVADVFPQQEQTIGRVQLRIFGRHQADEKVYSADSDEAAPLFRDDCAPGFRDDLAPCWWGLQAIIVVSSFRRGVKLFAVGFGADCRRSIRHGGHCGRGDPRWHRRKSGLL